MKVEPAECCHCLTGRNLHWQMNRGKGGNTLMGDFSNQKAFVF